MLKYLLNDKNTRPLQYEMAQRITPASAEFGFTSTTSNPYFGYGLIMSEDSNTLIVTAPFTNVKKDGETTTKYGGVGMVHILKRHNGVYQISQNLTMEMDELIVGNEKFGGNGINGVALSRNGDILVIGIPGKYLMRENGQRIAYGGAYAYRRNAEGAFELFQKIEYPGIALNSYNYTYYINTHFGEGVVISDDGRKLVISAYYDDKKESNNTYPGALYSFEMDDTNTFKFKQKISPDISISGESYISHFGRRLLSMSGDGNVLFAGSIFLPAPLVFQYNRGVDGNFNPATLLTKLTKSPNTGTVIELYHSTSAISKDGSIFMVSSPSEIPSISGYTKTGVVNVYKRNASGVYVEHQKIPPDENINDGAWCTSITISSDNKKIVIGWYASRVTSNAASTGAVYTFDLDSDGYYKQTTKNRYNKTGGFFGTSCATDATGGTIVASAPYINSGKGEIIIYK